MHPHDQIIERITSLKPQLFTALVRLDLREHFSFDIFEPESLLQLWFRADNEHETAKPFLHLSCYGVEPGSYFHLLWSLQMNPLQLKFTTIRQYQLTGKFFEVSCFDSGYDDYNTLFSCRHIEALLEDDFE